MPFNSSAFPQSGWVHQSSGTSSNLLSVYFINSETGWAAGANGVILHTSNGGANWTAQTSGSSLTIRSIMFTDENYGWASGGDFDNNPVCEDLRILLKTSNGGKTWIQLIGGAGAIYNDLFVTNNQTAYTCNAVACCPPFCFVFSGGVYRTSNSGQNWTGDIGIATYSINFINEITGWALSNYTSDVPPSINYVYKTTSGGDSWELIHTDTVNFFHIGRNIFFTDDVNGYMHFKFLKKTTDGGFTWINTDSAATQSITDLYFLNKDTGWCVGGGGKIIRTDNGASSWYSMNGNTTVILNSINFANDLTGWIVGNGGIILKTITGGLTTVNSNSTAAPDAYSLFQNYPNPFNPKTVIVYQIPKSGIVSLKIFDILGNEIFDLVNEKQSAGSYEAEFDGSGLASGIYFYRLETAGFIQTKRMALVK